MSLKNVPVGRPKGSENTVIGLKRKAPGTSKPLSQNAPRKRMKFFDKNIAEQGVVIATWLTNWPTNRIGQKKITIGDIIQDPHTFNRLRHKGIDLKSVKNYVDKKTFKYIEDEIERLKKKPFICRKCQKILTGLQIMCHGCLDWYHCKCIQVTPAVARNVEYFCSDC